MTQINGEVAVKYLYASFAFFLCAKMDSFLLLLTVLKWMLVAVAIISQRSVRLADTIRFSVQVVRHSKLHGLQDFQKTRVAVAHFLY